MPTCTRSERFSICTNWDLPRLQAELERLELIPPNVGQITVDVPTRQVSVVSGLRSTRCRRTLNACVPGGSVSVNQGGQLFDGSYRLRPGAGDPLARADLTWFGRQYREGSEYARSSDNHEGRGELRFYPWYGGAVLDPSVERVVDVLGEVSAGAAALARDDSGELGAARPSRARGRGRRSGAADRPGS